jgi:hypothetical protein
MLLLEALGWVVVAVIVAFAVEQLTDYSVAAVIIPVGGIVALGTFVEIWFPGPLTAKRHPKAPPSQ